MASPPSSFIAVLRPSSLILPFSPFPSQIRTHYSVPRTARVGKVRSHGAQEPELLRRPLVSAPSPAEGRVADPYISVEDEDEGDGDGGGVAVVESGMRRAEQGSGKGRSRRGRKDEGCVDSEDLILQDTVPLVGFVRMILHSGKYVSGDRLSPEHESTIMDRLLPYHPEFEKKIGCGINYITIGFHPEFENSRCLFIVREDGELVDFSYWKCIKGLIRKKYPLYADSFILRHFRRRSYNERSEL